ncbi:MAG: phosphoribosylanthranilate isomerase [Candidatus Omnitrophica bacterium]|nr:phosphoribosylanthranilate isomerase [Candidatus Omnitrophota bacterium]
MVRVKVCGITRLEDARAAIKAGADALGFVFYRKSPRYISASRALKIIEALPPFVSKVGVFVNERTGAIRDIAGFCALDAVQLHGDEDNHYCHRLKRYGLKIIKGFRVKEDFNISEVSSFRLDGHLFDAHTEGQYGGGGKVFAWELLKGLHSPVPRIISGGLKAENVVDAIVALKPFAVDVSSGVEVSPGIKDPRKIAEFIRRAKSVEF